MSVGLSFTTKYQSQQRLMSYLVIEFENLKIDHLLLNQSSFINHRIVVFRLREIK